MEEKENMGREMGRQKGKGRGGDRKGKAEMDRPAGRLREQRWGTSKRNQRDRGETGQGETREKPVAVETQGTRDEKVRNRMRKGPPWLPSG